jgi:integrase/recombinase XerD
MATTSISTAIAAIEQVFTEPERLALAGFLAGSTGLTREVHALNLRQYASASPFRTTCACSGPAVPASSAWPVTWKPVAAPGATITRRLCTSAGFYRYAVEEELLEHSPAAHVRRPAWTMSHTPPGWTATSLERCWSPPGSASPPGTR